VLDAFFSGKPPLGGGPPFLLVAGPCVIESEEMTVRIAKRLAEIAAGLPLQLVFKASYLKANRSHPDSYAGPGLEEGMRVLRRVKEATDLPILSDVHCRAEVKGAAEVLDVLQIPAYLCRQTPLITEAARTGKVINIKKGQFMAPDEMAGAVEKVKAAGNERIILTERGTFFGYHDLAVDFRSIRIMQKIGCPVLFDGTHSVQRPGGEGSSSGGNPEFTFPLCRAAVAVGCDGLFLEVHPRPAEARSDASSMLDLTLLPGLIEEVLRIRDVLGSLG
jgi:2-dehydro-3-deoxyphosphooctonate aldolase (KDO 8-P synthase)